MTIKFIGRSNVRTYTDKDNYRFTPGTGPKWQDSTWLQWWDLEANCGGVHRIGHEYNTDGGPFAALWNNVITPKGIYKRVMYQPLRKADKLDKGWGCGDDTCNNVIENGEHIWNVNDPEHGVSARLVFTDFHDAFCGFPSGGHTEKDISADHIDVAGPVTGTITVPGGTFKVKGMGLRDHGWGERNLGTLYSHRYLTASFGPELAFCANAFHNGVNDRIESFGWVLKGDTVVFATDVDIFVYAEIDSVSTRGAHITMKLADGDVFDCELTAVAPGMINGFPYFNERCNNTLCRAEAKGLLGTGMVETSMNFHYGSRKAERMLRALVKNGFYPGTMDEMRQRDDNPFVIKRTI